MTIESIKQQVKSDSAESVVKASIQKAKQDSHNAVLSVVEERALARAQEIDLKKSYDLPLAGVPFIAKDNFLTFDSETTTSSNILKGFRAPYQSTAINKLEEAGAILVGKANLDAFAHGSSTENSDFGPTLNPVDTDRVPGGSSGGSAAAVALDMVPFTLGTDTGGSIRLPASFCGVVGYKPSYGLVSRYGVVAMASSTDVIGPLAHSVDDVGRIMTAMSGQDAFDSTMVTPDAKGYDKLSVNKDVKVAVIKEYMGDLVSKEVRTAIQRQVEKLQSQGVEVKEVSLPAVEQALACYYIIAPAEISSNLARYDGIRYGRSSKEAKNLDDVYELTRSEGFNDENKRRIMIGNYVLSSGYYDAYYKKAMQVRTILMQQFNKAFEEYDVLLGPVAPSPAFKIGSHTDQLSVYMTDVMTVGVSLVGAPAISLPVEEANGLPVGLQIVGKQGQDRKVLEFARYVEELQS